MAWSRLFLIAGAVFVGIGLLLWLLERHGWPRLPGDIVIERPSFRIYLPLGTSLLLSLLLSALFYLLGRLGR